MNSATRDIRLSEYHELMDLLGLDSESSRFEVYNSLEDRWDCHSNITIITLAKDEPLLLRKLPNGISGPKLRLEECHGLAEEIDKLKARRARGHGALSSSLAKRRHDEANIDAQPELAQGAASKFPRTSLDPLSRRPSSSSTPSTTHVQHARTSETRSSWSPPPVEQLIQAALDNLKNAPIFGKRPYRSDGKRKWPGTYSTPAIIAGVERITKLLSEQSHPKKSVEYLFGQVFGKNVVYGRSNYQAHAGTVRKLSNRDLVNAHRDNATLPWVDFVDIVSGKPHKKADSDSEVEIVDDGGLGVGVAAGGAWLSGGESSTNAIVVDGVAGDAAEQSAHGGEGGDGSASRDDSNSDDGGSNGNVDRETTERSDGIDPLNICPYCDETLPAKPSPKFLAELQRYNDSPISYPDPTEENPHHRSTRPAVEAAALCEIHRVEFAIQNDVAVGWPTEIRGRVFERKVRSLRPELQAILNDPTSSLFYGKMKKMAQHIGSSNVFRFTGNTQFASKYGQGAA